MKADTLDLRTSEKSRLDMLCKIAISALAVIWIGWQLYGGLRIINDDEWPFTGYAMYAKTRHVGDPIFQDKFIGHTVSGKEVLISHEDFDLSYWGLWFRIYELGYQKVVPQLFVLYNQTRADPQDRLQRLDVVQEGKVLGIKGAPEPYKKFVFTYEVSK